MLSSVAGAWYFPNLKAKLGECTALRTVRAPVRRRMKPICIVPPPSYDAELGREPGPLEHLRLFGHRLSSWGRDIIFIDAARVDDAKHRAVVETHPLTELLERGHVMGALPCPLVTLQSSPEYQEATARFVHHHHPLPICLRLSAADLESRSLALDIQQLLLRLNIERDQVMVLLDFNYVVLPSEAKALESFAGLLIDRINAFPGLHEWLGIAVALTSFPQEFKKLKAGDVGRYARIDWSIYKRLFMHRERLIRLPAFSDYAVESMAFLDIGPVSPAAQFRYTSTDEYLLVKGPNTKNAGYEAIFDVAKRLVAMPEFSGATFSEGDASIAALAGTPSSTGNASMWRWASTDHHLSFAMAELGALLGHDIDTRIPAEPDQLVLWPQ